MSNRALIIVDVQNDFCEGGSLAVEGGTDVAQRISEYILENQEQYALIVATRDWHEGDNDNCGHFSDNPDYVDSWPVHCVQGTEGAQFHPDLTPGLAYVDWYVHKGMGVPAYSGFEGIDLPSELTLDTILSSEDIDKVDVCGLAFDYCVKATAVDAALNRYDTSVIYDLVASVHSENDHAVMTELSDGGVKIA